MLFTFFSALRPVGRTTIAPFGMLALKALGVPATRLRFELSVVALKKLDRLFQSLWRLVVEERARRIRSGPPDNGFQRSPFP